LGEKTRIWVFVWKQLVFTWLHWAAFICNLKFLQPFCMLLRLEVGSNIAQGGTHAGGPLGWG
jgi:hypothetical protein